MRNQMARIAAWQGRNENALPTSTISSDQDLVLFSHPALNPAYTLVFGVVATSSHQEEKQAVKYVYGQRPSVEGARYQVPWFATGEEEVGTPGATVVSLADWPELWAHPERLRAARNLASLVAHFSHQEAASWHMFVESFEMFLTLQGVPGTSFERLAATWRSEVRFLSDTNEICIHPAYQQIIGMGVLALPFIFAELQREPDHWFWALKAITGQDPVPEEHRGDLAAMTKDWLSWARGWRKRLASDWERVFIRLAC